MAIGDWSVVFGINRQLRPNRNEVVCSSSKTEIVQSEEKFR